MFEGANIGQYRILGKIGEGGMGAVYVGEHAMIGRRAAIKVLLPALSAQRDFVDRFFNEARATTAIPDPGIVQVFDFGFHNGSAYIVMELLEGESLDARLRRLRVVPASEALRIARQCAGSLAAAHSRGIVHRDLKPDNLFMVRDPEAMGGERPKILDFGIAKLSGENRVGSHTRTGALMGTPVYMSPEQCRGTGAVDHRSDIYALGCVLYHLLVGRPPFNHEGVGDIISAHVRDQPQPPSALAVGLPAGVDDLVMRCLEKAPDARFQSMPELQAAADALLARISNVAGGHTTLPLATPLAPGFRSVSPQASSVPLNTDAVMTQANVTPTAAGQPSTLAPAPRQRRLGVWIGIAAGLVVGTVAFVATRRGAHGAAKQPAVPAIVAPVDAAAAVVAPPAPPPDAAPAVPATTPDAAPPDAAPPPPDAAPKPHTHSTHPTHPTNPTHGDLYDTR
jgi:serine/threonine protein kinase